MSKGSRVDDIVVSVVLLVAFSTLLFTGFVRSKGNTAIGSLFAFLVGLVGIGASVFLLIVSTDRRLKHKHKRVRAQRVAVSNAQTPAEVRCDPGFVLVGKTCRRMEGAPGCPVNTDYFLGADDVLLVGCDLARNTGERCETAPSTKSIATACVNEPFWGGCANNEHSPRFIGGFFCASNVSKDAKRLEVTQVTAMNGRGPSGKLTPHFAFTVSRIDGGFRFNPSSTERNLTVVMQTPSGQIIRRKFLANYSWDGVAPYVITTSYPELANPSSGHRLLVLLHSQGGEVVAYNDPPLEVVFAEFPGVSDPSGTYHFPLILDFAMASTSSAMPPSDSIESAGNVNGAIYLKRKGATDERTIIGAFRIPRLSGRVGVLVKTANGVVIVDKIATGGDNVVFTLNTKRGDKVILLIGLYSSEARSWEESTRKSDLSVVDVSVG